MLSSVVRLFSLYPLKEPSHMRQVLVLQIGNIVRLSQGETRRGHWGKFNINIPMFPFFVATVLNLEVGYVGKLKISSQISRLIVFLWVPTLSAARNEPLFSKTLLSFWKKYFKMTVIRIKICRKTGPYGRVPQNRFRFVPNCEQRIVLLVLGPKRRPFIKLRPFIK